MSDDLRAAHERFAELERRREAIGIQLEQPWDQAARYRRTVGDLNRVNAELVKDGTIDAEEAAPIELVKEEIGALGAPAPEADPSDILAYSNEIPLPTAEQEGDMPPSAPAEPDAATLSPAAGGETTEGAPATWASVFQPEGANGAQSNGAGSSKPHDKSAAQHTQLSLFDL
jgi:hypothetical protein